MKICSDINLSEHKAIELERLFLYREHLFILSGVKKDCEKACFKRVRI